MASQSVTCSSHVVRSGVGRSGAVVAGVVRGRSHPGGTGGSAAAARSPARARAPVRASRWRSARTRCTTGRTDTGAVRPGLSNDGTRRSGADSTRAPATWAAAQRVTLGHGHSSLTAVTPRGAGHAGGSVRLAGRRGRAAPARSRRPGPAESRVRPPAAAGSDPHHHVGTRRQRGQPVAEQVAQPPPHLVADDRRADRLGHDETRPGRTDRRVVARPRRLPDRRGRTRSPPRPARRPPRTAAANSSRRRRRWPAASTISSGSTLRPRGGRAPWPDARRGPRDRRGCACAAGSRGSWRADGCSAGTCACSLSMPSVLRRCRPRDVRPPTGGSASDQAGRRTASRATTATAPRVLGPVRAGPNRRSAVTSDSRGHGSAPGSHASAVTGRPD